MSSLTNYSCCVSDSSSARDRHKILHCTAQNCSQWTSLIIPFCCKQAGHAPVCTLLLLSTRRQAQQLNTVSGSLLPHLCPYTMASTRTACPVWPAHTLAYTSSFSGPSNWAYCALPAASSRISEIQISSPHPRILTWCAWQLRPRWRAQTPFSRWAVQSTIPSSLTHLDFRVK